MKFYIFPVTVFFREQKPQSFYTDVVDGMSSLVVMVSSRFVHDVSQMFFEAGIKDMSSFVDVEFGAIGAVYNVHNVVRLAKS